MKPKSAPVAAHPPVWLFSLLPIAGAAYPFVAVTMPFLLHREGIPVSTIAGISALALLPNAFQFVYAPIADMFLSRRNWVWAGNLAGAVLLFTAILLPRPQYLVLFAVLLALANVFVLLGLTAIGGLMAVLLPDQVRGKGAAWYQMGNFGSISFLGGAALVLVEKLPLQSAALGIALLSFLPSLSVLLIREPPRSVAPNRALFGAMYREIGALLKNRPTWLGLAMFLSPLGAGAAANLFTAVGGDYRASASTIQWVTGIPGGVIASMAGALAAAAITDRMPRRHAYLIFGALIGVGAGAMALAPLRPFAFAAGGLVYQFATAMAWAGGTAYGLELSGADPATAGTRMALFNGAMNAPVSYMAWLDGLGYKAGGVRSMLGADALLDLASVVVLAVAFRFFYRNSRPANALNLGLRESAR